MEARYQRNIPAISEAEQEVLGQKHVLIVGCGGLGGYLVEYMTRMGVGGITAVDGDVFDESNLNRQLLSSVPQLGCSKAFAAKERAQGINPAVAFQAVREFFNRENADALVQGHDLVLDALDNIPARWLLEDVCTRQSVPVVHGAIHGWSAQVLVVEPGSGLLHRLYPKDVPSIDKSSLPFTPPFCAALQAAEAVKLLCGRSTELSGKLLLADLLSLDWNILDL
ncbi:MAG: ThiF family adenylyltransferase [Lawsonibacter sp.]